MIVSSTTISVQRIARFDKMRNKLRNSGVDTSNMGAMCNSFFFLLDTTAMFVYILGNISDGSIFYVALLSIDYTGREERGRTVLSIVRVVAVSLGYFLAGLWLWLGVVLVVVCVGDVVWGLVGDLDGDVVSDVEKGLVAALVVRQTVGVESTHTVCNFKLF